MNQTDQNNAVYSIGAVARLTGLTTYTLRMWEHRYQAIVARREPNGRRIYSPADVEKLSLLKTFVDRGTKIGSIANMDLEALRARADQDEELQSQQSDRTIHIAAMGATISAMIQKLSEMDGRFRLPVASIDPGELAADMKNVPIDTLVLEWPVLDHYAVARTKELAEQSKADRAVVIYRFARRQETSSLESERYTLLRGPVNEAELRIALLSSSQTTKTALNTGIPESKRQSEDSMDKLPAIPTRIYSPNQLARLGNIQSSIDCECPIHLSEILSSLGAFEIYSQNCEDRDDKDAELHAYLHVSTAQARATMEAALKRLIKAEGLSL